MTQQELGSLLALSVGAVSRVENGACSMPTYRAADFARTLAVDAQEFALLVLGFMEPQLFGLIFPTATLEPLAVPAEDLRRANAVLNRRAVLKRRQRAKAG